MVQNSVNNNVNPTINKTFFMLFQLKLWLVNNRLLLVLVKILKKRTTISKLVGQRWYGDLNRYTHQKKLCRRELS
jgi:hypothetical protein